MIASFGGSPLRRAAAAVFAFTLLTAAAVGTVRWMQFVYAPPTAEEYLAHLGSGATLIPAGALAYDGQNFTCGRFPTILNAKLDDYGAAFFGFVLLNPMRFDAMPLTLKRYAYAHECGHQYVGYDEGEADCYAVRRGHREGWLDAQAMDDICAFISRSKGDGVHALGTRRCQMMRQCLARSRTGREPL
jgi:hypothetical protein